MTEPAKDDIALLRLVGEEIRQTLTSPPYCMGDTGCNVSPCGCSQEAGKAAIAAIRAAGWAVVPVEPTEEMLREADRAPWPSREEDDPDHPDFILFAHRRAEWAAMIAAAPGVKP
jgi:hypothetical protein